tara:strand:+ start:28 stop:678 length:651 start_codon:yes stop_codon:yes gene_type:complete
VYISVKNIIKNYNLNIRGIIHIGACKGEEIFSYFRNGIKKIVLIEANIKLINRLKFKSFIYNNLFNMDIKIENFAASDRSGNKIKLNIANNTQSSSILKLGKHSDLYPEIKYINEMEVETNTINQIFQNKYNIKEFNFMNLDIQGAELLALKGSDNILRYIDAIYTEVNLDEIYLNCARIEDIDKYLEIFGFERVLLATPESDLWGDALYVKKIKY